MVEVHVALQFMDGVLEDLRDEQGKEEGINLGHKVADDFAKANNYAELGLV